MAAPAFGIGAAITTKAAVWIAAWKAWRACRRDIASLEAMDERMLRDIGLTRSEIGRAVRFGRHDG
jgi:uncharacterized protein YjiS (DUF1127 family)